MGLFNFKKKSQETKPDDNRPLYLEDKHLALSLPLKKDFVSTFNDSSLLDDILNELDSSTTVISSVLNKETESPSSDYNKISNFSITTPTVQSYSTQSFTIHSNTSKPTMTISSSVPDITYSHLKNTDDSSHNSSVPTDSSDDDDESEVETPVIRRSVTFQNLPIEQAAVPLGQKKKTDLNTPHQKSVDIINSQKSAMNRMKERHRRHARQTPPPMDIVSYTPRDRMTSSPSMPVRVSAPLCDFQNTHSRALAVEAYIPQRPIVQSQSFTVCSTKPKSPIVVGNMPVGNIMRNTFSLNDIANDFENNPKIHMKETAVSRRIPSGNIVNSVTSNSTKRHSHLQGSGEPGLSTHEPITTIRQEELGKPLQFQFRRSTSAYPSSQDETFQYQRQLEFQQQQYQHQLFMQQLQKQRLQQQIEFQQHQLQEQQFIHQQHLKQLNQQHQIINQTILDSTKRILHERQQQKSCHYLPKKPLYERCTSKNCYSHNQSSENKVKHKHHHYHQQQPNKQAQRHNEEQDKESHTESVDHSSSSTVIEENTDTRSEESLTIHIPDKLRRELQQMQRSRSNYSLPDISLFAKDATDESFDGWKTIEPFKKNARMV